MSTHIFYDTVTRDAGTLDGVFITETQTLRASSTATNFKDLYNEIIERVTMLNLSKPITFVSWGGPEYKHMSKFIAKKPGMQAVDLQKFYEVFTGIAGLKEISRLTGNPYGETDDKEYRDAMHIRKLLEQLKSSPSSIADLCNCSKIYKLFLVLDELYDKLDLDIGAYLIYLHRAQRGNES